MFLRLFNVHKDGVIKVKMGMGRRGESGVYLASADELVLCGESEEEMKALVGRFSEVCRRRGLKANAGKSKVMVLNGDEGLECEVYIGMIHLEHVSEFKYLEYV